MRLLSTGTQIPSPTVSSLSFSHLVITETFHRYLVTLIGDVHQAVLPTTVGTYREYVAQTCGQVTGYWFPSARTSASLPRDVVEPTTFLTYPFPLTVWNTCECLMPTFLADESLLMHPHSSMMIAYLSGSTLSKTVRYSSRPFWAAMNNSVSSLVLPTYIHP